MKHTMQPKFKNKLIIRSSSYFEDSYKSSKAGAYKSVGNVNVKKKNQIKNTIKEVINSYDKPNKKNQILFQEYLDKANAAARAVAVKTPPKSKPPSASITGFKNMMYAIVKKVDTPAITSVLKSVLCFL